MAYADFVATDEFTSKHSGSGVEIVIIDENNPAEIIIGATSGINFSDDFETLPIEEAGNDGVDEIVQGRHSGTCSLPAFFTPRANDALPTRQSFIGKAFVILERVAVGRPGAGTVLMAYTGAKLSRLGGQQGARGVKTIDMAFTYERRFNGAEWAELVGVS